ncbi:exported hypothetical protein [Desulfamplus magnetovallimortis]|uniref:Outer membrane efflux protein n=1 Tax=Desulfamplus magnetovallimortis TaxID=1246637 RepID=A0A1W1HAE7_9BACT|nr:TolC family protein [Desulfamplus magnetovallimortis]SLM29392.1 exported hypothetical protein [Desulfamplus magnetovallimortis]
MMKKSFFKPLGAIFFKTKNILGVSSIAIVDFVSFCIAVITVLTIFFSPGISDTSTALADETSSLALKLDLETVMKDAIENNLALKVSRMTPQKEKENIQVAESIFDPVVTAGVNADDQETWNEPIDSDAIKVSGEASVSKFMPSGTTVSLSLKALDSTAETEGVGDTGGSYVQGALAVSHPLMKNRGEDVNRRNIKLAENQYQKSEMELKQAVIDTLSTAQTLYWSYYNTLDSLKVYEQSLELARRFIKEVEEKVKMGSAARLDILQARSEVASRETEVITAGNNVLNSRETLLTYIYGEADPNVAVECITPPSIPSMAIEGFDEARLIDMALELRTDYLSTVVDLDSADVNLVYYKNQMQPQLDIGASFVVNDAQADNEAYDSGEYKNYYYGGVGVTLAFPWGLKGEKASFASAKLGKKQLQISRDAVKSAIILDVRTALRDLTASVKRYETARLASRYSSESLDAEQVKFRNGLSTSYNVLLYQRDLTNARVKEVEAEIACQIALITLYQAVGNTLEENNISLEDSI